MSAQVVGEAATTSIPSPGLAARYYIDERVAEISASVEAVDAANRAVTLKSPNLRGGRVDRAEREEG